MIQDDFRILRVKVGTDLDAAAKLGLRATCVTLPTGQPAFPGYIFVSGMEPVPNGVDMIGWLTQGNEYVRVSWYQLQASIDYIESLSSPEAPFESVFGPNLARLLTSNFSQFTVPLGSVEFYDVVHVRRFGKQPPRSHRHLARPSFAEALSEYRYGAAL